jgi:hypothetical protein
MGVSCCFLLIMCLLSARFSERSDRSWVLFVG